MRPRLYLESTIPSYLTARRSRDRIVAGHQQATRVWWETRRNEFDIYISQFVIDEIAVGDPAYSHKRLEIVQPFPLLDVSDAVTSLAAAMVNSGTIPAKAVTDAAHIAVSAVRGMDYLLTWNCAHIANAGIMRRVWQHCLGAGLRCPVICTPDELMGDP